MKHPFEYKRYHDEVKNRLLTEINQAPGRIHPAITDQTGQLVKKVLYGGLSRRQSGQSAIHTG